MFRSGPPSNTKVYGKNHDLAHFRAKVRDVPNRKLLMGYQKKKKGLENVNPAILERFMNKIQV